jgi:LmbE family N-acetylglucosaminyl deacetylase
MLLHRGAQVSTVVISPHVDDAVFSIGAYLSHLDDDITIAAPMAGIPADEAGLAKHTTLRCEHERATTDALLRPPRLLNGDFLDDVYEPPPIAILTAWLRGAITGAESVYVPVGIHHPDHVMVADALIPMLEGRRRVCFYEELPYRVLYPQLLPARGEIISHLGRFDVQTVWPTAAKERAVRCYASQVDDALVATLLMPEHIWRMR